MKKLALKFTHIIYNQDTESISFIHLGKPSIKTRLSFNSEPSVNNKKNYAFKPRSIDEFMLFLEYTELAPSRNFNDYSFKSFRIMPSKEIEDEITFNWIATRFASKYLNSPDDLRIFIHKCNVLKQEKISNLNQSKIERE